MYGCRTELYFRALSNITQIASRENQPDSLGEQMCSYDSKSHARNGTRNGLMAKHI